MLFTIFAGFNYADFDIRWIQPVVDQFGHFPQKIECDAGAVAAVSDQPLRQNDTCPMWVFEWIFFVVSGMEFAHTCHVFRFHDWAMAVESFVFWYKCLCSNAFALIPIAFGLRSHDTARWTCVGSFAETVVVSVARTSFWMLIFVGRFLAFLSLTETSA